MMKRLLFFFFIVCVINTLAFGQCESLFNKSCPYSKNDTIFQQVIDKDAYCCYAFWDANCQASYYYLQTKRQRTRPTTIKNDTLCESSFWRDDNDALCEFFFDKKGFDVI